MQRVARIARTLLVIVAIGHARTDTGTVSANIDHGTSIGIIAILRVVLMDASGIGNAGIVSARLTIIAIHNAQSGTF